MKERKHRAVFLDRDGVINKKAPEGDYIKSWGEFEFLPGVGEAIKKLKEKGFLVIIVSNQKGIAKGLMTEDNLKEIHIRMEDELGKEGAMTDGIYYCPHDIKDHCSCRKPEPGLLLRAAREHDIDLDRSWMIGDRGSDIEAGKKAGCKTILITNTPNVHSNPKEIELAVTVKNLAEAVNKILSHRSPIQD